MADQIWLRGISAHAFHGVFATERRKGQQFVLDVGYELDLRPAARSDDVARSVSYADVSAAVHGELTGEPVNLLETLAERVAGAVLAFPGVTAVEVVLHKPQAPLAVPFSDVVLSIRRTPATVVPNGAVECVLALGGNVGDVPATLAAAVDELAAVLGDLRVGPLVRTGAMVLPGTAQQPDYWNTVVVARTRLAASEVLDLARAIEARYGRIRQVRWGERTLDIDLISHGSTRSADPALLLPHPGAADRPFVLVPWAAVDPDAELDGRRVADLADTGEIRERREGWR
ncbi:MAG: 2-amino-4-hydroxy-6-hydroxymethyldihydropteridine diphosphokinase [Actinomycetota bacterium]